MTVSVTSDHATDGAEYRPLSGLAVAGFAVGTLFALGVGIVGAIALYTGLPLLMPWLLLVALAGAGLSLAGWLQVRRSEGTRAGLALARWGWWLSLLFGLGYASYLFATGLAIRQQGREFSDAWLQKLAEGDENTAFLLTRPIEQRQGDNPHDLARLRARYLFQADQQKGPLPWFRQQELVRLLRQAGPDATIEYLGVPDWHFQAGGYRVDVNYRLKSAEGTFDFRLPLFGREASAAETKEPGKIWQVLFHEPLGIEPVRWTALGIAVQDLRNSGRRFVQEWGEKLRLGRFEEAFLETRPPPVRSELQHRYAAGLLGFAVAAGSSPAGPLTAGGPVADLDLGRRLFLPGFAAFAEGQPIDRKDLRTAGDAIRAALDQALPHLLDPRTAGPPTVLRVPALPTPFQASWRLEGDVVRLSQPVEILVGGRYIAEGVAELAAADPALVRRLDEMFQQGGEPKDASAAAIVSPTWQLVQVHLSIAYESR